MAVDILIIRNRCDAATIATHAIGDGLAQYLETKGFSVTDLSDADTSPQNVVTWLNSDDGRTRKLIIGFDHGGPDSFYGELNNRIEAVITNDNAAALTERLHTYTFACSTNGENGLGETAVQGGCYSWLGYTEPVYVITDPNSGLFRTLKDIIWSYITALAEGKTLEHAESALRNAYTAHISDHWIFNYNLQRLRLVKKQSNMTIHSHNREDQVGVEVMYEALFGAASC